MTIRQQFKSAIQRGTGEAYLILLQNSSLDFSSDIIRGSVRNLSYDNQCEGSRATYMFGLIQVCPQKDKVRMAILKALATERTDGYALEQLFDLAALFAKSGDKEARQAIYRRFGRKRITRADWEGENALLMLDGLEGLKHIAEAKGKAMQKDPGYWEDSWLVDHFQEQHPDLEVYQELEIAAAGNACIQCYLDSILQHKHSPLKRDRPKYSYEVVTERINSGARIVLPPAGAKDLTASDIQKLADDCLKETQRLRLEKYMRVFDRVQFPYGYQPLLAQASRSLSGRDRLVEYAAGALRFFTAKPIRQFALEKLEQVRMPFAYLPLLVSNYRKGDAQLLTSLITRCRTQHEVHAMASGILAIYKANPTKECRQPLEALYDRLTCGICREELVSLLIQNKSLPVRIRKEISHDSYEGVRKLAAKA